MTEWSGHRCLRGVEAYSTTLNGGTQEELFNYVELNSTWLKPMFNRPSGGGMVYRSMDDAAPTTAPIMPSKPPPNRPPRRKPAPKKTPVGAIKDAVSESCDALSRYLACSFFGFINFVCQVSG